MFDVLQYGFFQRGLAAGILIAIIAPLIGIFLVLRRYSLIADTLSHVSLAGVAVGLLAGINPVVTALFTSGFAALAIERLRSTKKVYGETALSIFLSGGLALAVVLISVARGFNVNLFGYLFGSIVTVKAADIVLISALGAVVLGLLIAFYKELVYISFDEEAARVSGVPVQAVNFVFILLTAITIALSIPIVGILLVSALIVVPVVTALQLKKSFTATLWYAEGFSIFSVISGIFVSYYYNLSPGGTIVLITLALFSLILALKR
jgi:zinc transport system permease protein